MSSAAIETDHEAICVRGLRKSFRRGGSEHLALDGVSFELRRGERLAYLGPNGAGKTTLIRCISGRTRPDQGSIHLMGRSINQLWTRDVLGVVPQEIAIYLDLTTRENLHAFGRFHGLYGKALRQQVDWALQWIGLEDRGDELVGQFSGGMKRRVNIACGVLHQPDVLLLDEPTVGVDPQSRQRIFAMLDELNHSGTSILLTTHHLDEAQVHCDRIVIVDHGRVVAAGTFDELVSQTVGRDRVVSLQLAQAVRGTGNEALAMTSAPMTVRPGEDHVTARVHDVAGELPGLLHAVQAAGYDLTDIEIQTPTLHHVFLHLTGHELRD